jgi:hypothetical protein
MEQQPKHVGSKKYMKKTFYRCASFCLLHKFRYPFEYKPFLTEKINH